MQDQVQGLIDILLDKAAREDERDDAATYLRKYKDLRALEALTKIASDPNEDNVIVDSCAESFAAICVGLNQFNEISFRKMIPFAQSIVFYYIMIHKPELIKQPLRNELAREVKMEDQIQSIDILSDKTAQKNERVASAINLKKYKNSLTSVALTPIVSDLSEDDEIISICAESIAEICIAWHYFNEKSFREMTPFAQKVALRYIFIHKPGLLKQSLIDELIKELRLEDECRKWTPECKD